MTPRALSALVVLCAAVYVSAACPALAAAPARYRESLDAMVRYLQDDQNPDGGFGSEPGSASNNDFTAWVALALAAASINPRDQFPGGHYEPGDKSAYTYLTEHAGELSVTTDFERELLVVDTAGTSPEAFGGVNLVHKILERQLPEEGSFPHEAGSPDPGMNDTIFAILALSPIPEPAVQQAVEKAAEWVEREQNADGSWPATCPKTQCSHDGIDPEGEVDMTGAAIEALNVADRHGPEAERVQKKAFEYLGKAQDPNGGFPEEPGQSEPNVASTAWAVQAMWSAGLNPEEWRTRSGEEPLSYMASLQQPDGHIRWRQSQDWNGVWMTAYVGAAMAGDPLPIPYAPYVPVVEEPSPDSSTPSGPSPSAAGSELPGLGGESAQPGSGVLSGGGGNGAKLFSRPQPQSRGTTPGGVRLLAGERAKSARKRTTEKSTTKRRRNPGRVRKTPVPVVRSSGSRHKGTGTGASGSGKGGGGAGGSGREIKGFLISDTQGAPQPGAPGLLGAGAGGNQTPWLAVAIGGLILLLILAGSLLERRRPQVIL
jgi:prenyltransferase beta subunit